MREATTFANCSRVTAQEETPVVASFQFVGSWGVLGFAGGVLMPFFWVWGGGGKREAKAALREIIVLLTEIFTLV